MVDRRFSDCFFYHTENNPRLHINTLNSSGTSALHAACESEFASIANIANLLDNGANAHLAVPGIKYTPLKISLFSYFQRHDLVRLRNIFTIFFERGFCIDEYQDFQGDTIMHGVAKYVVNDENFCTMVVLNGGGVACLHLRNFEGRTPLEEAYRADNLGFIAAIEKYLRKRNGG
jgi:ankyrin repeat protein